MAIKHTKTAIPDVDKVDCVDWNVDHTIDSDVPFSNNKATGVKDPTLDQDAATKKYVDNRAVKAWVYFSGTTIYNSFNVSHIVSYGAGTYGIYFINAMPNTNYCITGSAGGNVGYTCIVSPYLRYTTYVRVRTTTHAGSWTNPPDVNVAIFGD